MTFRARYEDDSSVAQAGPPTLDPAFRPATIPRRVSGAYTSPLTGGIDAPLQALVDTLSDFAWVKDTASRFVAVNRSLALLVGLTPTEMLGTNDHDYFPAAIADRYLVGDREVLEHGLPYRSVDSILTVAGGIQWIETIKNAIRDESGAIIGTSGLARDITDRYELEADRQRLVDELALERNRLTAMIANVPGVVWEEMLDRSHRFVSEQVETMLGYTVDECVQLHSFLDLVHPEDWSIVVPRNAEVIANGQAAALVFRMIRKDGSTVWCESHCRAIEDSAGARVGLRGVTVDVSARKEADDRLRASEEHFRSLANATPVMIWETNSSGEAVFQNSRTLAFFGAGDASGRRWTESLHSDDSARVLALLDESNRREIWTSFETRCRRWDGEYRDLFVEAAPRIKDGVFAGFAGTCVDLTDRRRLERRLEQERQLGSLGRFAAMIAHEINNVLMAIQPFADLIRKAPSPEVLARAANHITSSIHRGGRITHQILRFASTSDAHREPIEAKLWLAGIAEELEAVLGPDVKLEIDAPERLYMLADRHQMMQVLSNLAANSREAMPLGGKLRISAQLESSWPGLAPEQAPFVHLIVRDNGPGIPSDLLDRIFEPLFTTKASGTGLGLAIVQDIMLRQEGFISVESRPGTGAVFHIVLEATALEPIAPVKATDSLPDGVRRILLVEDDEMVALAVCSLLEMEGAEVRTVARGAEATDAIAAFSPDVVVLDIGLPDMPGTAVFDLIRSQYADLPILFSTGHAGELSTGIKEMSGPTAYLLKPYDAPTLMAALHDLVHSIAM